MDHDRDRVFEVFGRAAEGGRRDFGDGPVRRLFHHEEGGRGARDRTRQQSERDSYDQAEQSSAAREVPTAHKVSARTPSRFRLHEPPIQVGLHPLRRNRPKPGAARRTASGHDSRRRLEWEADLWNPLACASHRRLWLLAPAVVARRSERAAMILASDGPPIWAQCTVRCNDRPRGQGRGTCDIAL